MYLVDLNKYSGTLYNVDAVVWITQTLYRTMLCCTLLICTALEQSVVQIYGCIPTTLRKAWKAWIVQCLHRTPLISTTLKANVVWKLYESRFVKHWKSTLYDTMVYDTILAESSTCTMVVSNTIASYNIEKSMLYKAIWYHTLLIRVFLLKFILTSRHINKKNIKNVSKFNFARSL